MNRMSSYTDILINKLPYWFKIKKKPNESIGAKFLNVFGLEFDDMRYILEYAFRQVYINEMDINYLNKAYKAYMPSSIDTKNIKDVRSNFITLSRVNDLTDFFNITFDYYENPDNYDRDVYLLDEKREIIYVKKDYDKNKNFKFGKVTIILNDDSEMTLNLVPHAVWNFFDEIGLLLECPRLENEDNFSYKNRILDVFKHIRGANKDGLLNAISSELNLRKTIVWEDTSKDLVLREPMIIVNKIKINGSYVSLDKVYTDKDNNIVLKKENESRENVEVTYVYNLELHALVNKNDEKLYSELLNIDNTATDLLNNYFNKIHSISPIVWGKFIWDKSYWDIIDKNIGGIAFIPNLLDGKIEGFRNYLK